MKSKVCFVLSILPLLCILLFTGCAGTVEKNSKPSASVSPSVQPTGSPFPEEADGQTVTLSAHFRREDGTALSQQAIRLSDGEKSVDYTLDGEGQLQMTGIPKTGTYTVSVLEGNEETGAMALSLSVGAVIDAVTGADGVGHVTLKGDTDTVSLDFILDNDGTLTCSLHLSGNDGQRVNEA